MIANTYELDPHAVMMEAKEDWYVDRVLTWHEVAGIEISPETVINYLTNPKLLQQEIAETISALEAGNTAEIVDGLLDVIWECIPVLEYFKSLTQMIVHTGHELKEINDIPIGEILEDMKLNLPEIKMIVNDPESFPNWAAIIRDVYALKYIATKSLRFNLIVEEGDILKLKKLYEEVVNSNFSKFIECYDVVKTPNNSALKDILEAEAIHTENKYGKAFHSYNITDGSVEGKCYVSLYDESGKLLKPSTFKEPQILKILA